MKKLYYFIYKSVRACRYAQNTLYDISCKQNGISNKKNIDIYYFLNQLGIDYSDFGFIVWHW